MANFMTAEDGINVVTGIGASFSLLGNVILAVTYIMFWKSRLLNSKKDALILDSAARFISVLAFLLSGSFAGVFYCIFCIFRNHTGEKMRGQLKVTKMKAFLIMSAILCAVFFLLLVLELCNPLDVIIIVIYGTANLYGVIAGTGMKGMLEWNIASALFHGVFSLITWNIPGLVIELVSLVIYFMGLSKNKEGLYDI